MTTENGEALWTYDEKATADAYALGYARGFDVATARAVSRQQQRLSIDGEPVPHEQCEGAES